MALRAVQYGLAGMDCVYGAVLAEHYGHGLRAAGAWPEPALLLIVFSVLPAGVLALRFPLLAGVLEFACAFLGRQFLHGVPYPDLTLYSALSMTWSLAILAVVVFRGIVEVTREAYGETEHQDDRYVPVCVREAEPEMKVASAGGARNQLWF